MNFIQFALHYTLHYILHNSTQNYITCETIQPGKALLPSPCNIYNNNDQNKTKPRNTHQCGWLYLQGGVGKSTLTFHIASQFAKTHPERYLEYQNIFSVHSKNEKCYRRILIVDMCPQANVSTALLGASGDPVSSRLETIRNNLVVEQSDEEEEAKCFKSM